MAAVACHVSSLVERTGITNVVALSRLSQCVGYPLTADRSVTHVRYDCGGRAGAPRMSMQPSPAKLHDMRSAPFPHTTRIDVTSSGALVIFAG
jgi:hypothetical protein